MKSAKEMFRDLPCRCTEKNGFGPFIFGYGETEEDLKALMDAFSGPKVPVGKNAGYNEKTRIFTVFWDDETTTQTRVHEEDKMDPFLGYAMCLAKKLFNGSTPFHDHVKKIFNQPRQKKVPEVLEGKIGFPGATK